MTDRPVHLTTGLPETVLDPEPAEVRGALSAALSLDAPLQRDAVASVVAKWPRSLDVWSALGDLARDTIEGYAAYRVGYHRGLDRLRASGWRGSGYVRWRHEGNRGFLTAVDGLRRCAAEIGETDEQERCDLFLHQLDPDWDRREIVR